MAAAAALTAAQDLVAQQGETFRRRRDLVPEPAGGAFEPEVDHGAQ